jgi:RsiW-degrading membrane proteinase PrsW (M82 family)
MKENFTISFQNSHHYKYLWKIITSLLLSIIVVQYYYYYNKSKFCFDTIESILSTLILFLIIFIILISMSNENLSNELPSTLYPSIPHTGLDGISLNSYIAGMDSK